MPDDRRGREPDEQRRQAHGRSHAHWGGWRPHDHRWRERPPWWPQDEPFPQPGYERWRWGRRRFFRRIATGVAIFFGLMFLGNALFFAFFGDRFGEGGHGRFGFPFGFFVIVLVLLFLAAGRTVRRFAAPVGDVMEAADRVAGGDYSARVRERGAPEMRRLARSFNEMAERLSANEEQRSQLLADIAHELRTPLSVIRGSAEAMLDGVHAPDRSRLEPIVEETRVMSRLLEDLQTLSTAEAGALRLHRTSVSPADLVEDAVAAFGARAEEAGIALTTRVAPGLPAIDADEVRVGEVLRNLLQNAVRHTPRGGEVVVAAEPAQAGGVAFEVRDTGPGVAPDVLPHVFERFVKASDSGGVGLGLAIAKSLVEAHGGSIEATSEPGKGTTMRFLLPRSEPRDR